MEEEYSEQEKKANKILNQQLLKVRGFEIVSEQHKKHDNVLLPLRGTSKSAGYDFYSNDTVTIKPGEKYLFWTDIKAYMLPQEVLEIFVRSSIAIKKGLILCNQVGIIDADYHNNKSNDGNIGICLRNISNDDAVIKKEERIAQGIFKRFLISDNCNSDEDRTGGIGHTNG